MDESAESNALTIVDLEYDVGGNCAIEPGDAQSSNEVVVVWFVSPK